MSNESNAFWTVKSYPDGDVSEDNFELQRAPVPGPGSGEVLIKTTHLVVSPPLRMALGTGGIAGKPLPIGSLMRGSGQGRVVQSNHPDFAEGDLVAGPFGWQEYVVSNGAAQVPLTRVQTFGDLPVTTSLHVMGSGGATAYIGLYEYGHPKIGDVVVVSAAAGNVGSIVCQLAKLAGCRVVGIAGSEQKCRWLTNTLGVDAAINYKTADLPAALATHCPDGVDIYFDNVGGATLDAVLERINFGARVILCGATSQYEGDASWYGPKKYFNLVYKQASMHGFYIFNFQSRFPEILATLQSLIESGKLVYAEDQLSGVENLPKALINVLAGGNFGPQLVNLDA